MADLSMTFDLDYDSCTWPWNTDLYLNYSYLNSDFGIIIDHIASSGIHQGVAKGPVPFPGNSLHLNHPLFIWLALADLWPFIDLDVWPWKSNLDDMSFVYNIRTVALSDILKGFNGLISPSPRHEFLITTENISENWFSFFVKKSAALTNTRHSDQESVVKKIIIVLHICQ